MALLAFLSLALALRSAMAQDKPNWSYTNLPQTSESGQTGTNACGTSDSATAECQTLLVNSIEDLCIFGPPDANSDVGSTEEIQVAYCMQPGRT
jgi:hypothetical protein